MWQFMRLLHRTVCVWNSTPPTPTRQGCWRCCYGWMWLACLGANLHRTMMNVRVVVAGAFRTEKYTHSVLVFPFTFVCPSLDKGWPWARKEKRTTYLLRTIRCVWITSYSGGSWSRVRGLETYLGYNTACGWDPGFMFLLTGTRMIYNSIIQGGRWIKNGYPSARFVCYSKGWGFPWMTNMREGIFP